MTSRTPGGQAFTDYAGPMSQVPLSRSEQKERTRRAILDASLALTRETPLAALSLRAVAKQVGIVPTAFYRHFPSIDDLGLTLVDESFASLRAMLKDVRRGVPEFTHLIDDSLAVLVAHVHDHRDHYAFIARERVAGPPRVREAIRHEIELITRELVTDLARLPGTEDWPTDDLHQLADLIVSFVVTTAERVIADPAAEETVVARTRRQLRMLLIGALNWRPR